MSRSKAKGTAFESAVTKYLADTVDDRVERRALSGTKDCGDIAGLRTPWNDRVVVEVKNHARMNLAEWVDEAEAERLNDGAHVGVVVHKRPRKGAEQMGEQYVTMTLANFAKLLDGTAGDAL